MADKPREWKQWEKPFLTSTKNKFLRNTSRDMEQIIEGLGERYGTRFEFEAYNVGPLYSLPHLIDRGIVTGKNLMGAEETLTGIMRGAIEVPLYGLLGLRVVGFSSGEVKFSLTPSTSHANPYGTVAGGVIATSLDTAAAWVGDLQCPDGAFCTTIDIKVNFLRPLAVTDGEVQIVATPIHSGSRIMVSEAKMARSDGKLVAVAVATLAVLRA